MKPAAAAVQRRPALLPLLAAVLVIVATSALGRWQLHRAAEKQLLQQALLARQHQPAVDLDHQAVAPGDADALRFRPATASGTYLPAGQILIDNRNQDGQTGYHVLTPLQTARQIVLVNRGFVPRGANYPTPPRVGVPEGAVQVSGQLSLARSRFLELSADTVSGPVWQNLQLERYAAALHIQPIPLVLLSAAAPPGLSVVVETPDAGIAMHQGYAFQWFALAITTALITLYFTVFRKAPRQSD